MIFNQTNNNQGDVNNYTERQLRTITVRATREPARYGDPWTKTSIQFGGDDTEWTGAVFLITPNHGYYLCATLYTEKGESNLPIGNLLLDLELGELKIKTDPNKLSRQRIFVNDQPLTCRKVVVYMIPGELVEVELISALNCEGDLFFTRNEEPQGIHIKCENKERG